MVLRTLLAKSDDEAVATLRSCLDVHHFNTELKSAPSQLATRALLSLGPRGVDVIVSGLIDPDNDIRYSASVLATLWQVAQGRGLVDLEWPHSGPHLLDLELPEGTERAAAQGVRDIFAEALVELNTFWLIGRCLEETALLMGPQPGVFDTDARDLMGLFAEASTSSRVRSLKSSLRWCRRKHSRSNTSSSLQPTPCSSIHSPPRSSPSSA